MKKLKLISGISILLAMIIAPLIHQYGAKQVVVAIAILIGFAFIFSLAIKLIISGIGDD
jgi:hypothetical protein